MPEGPHEQDFGSTYLEVCDSTWYMTIRSGYLSLWEASRGFLGNDPGLLFSSCCLSIVEAVVRSWGWVHAELFYIRDVSSMQQVASVYINVAADHYWPGSPKRHSLTARSRHVVPCSTHLALHVQFGKAKYAEKLSAEEAGHIRTWRQRHLQTQFAFCVFHGFLFASAVSC